MWCRARHYSRPPTNSTAVPVVSRDRSPACALLHRSRERNLENLFVVSASVYPFNAGYSPIGLWGMRFDSTTSSTVRLRGRATSDPDLEKDVPMKGGVFIAVLALTGVTANPSYAQDAEHGKTIFKACAACHAPDQANRVGPGL